MGARRAWDVGVDPMGSGQTGDFLLGMKSSRWYRRQHLARRQWDDINHAGAERSGGDPQRVSTARPLQHGVAADDHRRPALERKHLLGRPVAAWKWSPYLDPTAVGRDATCHENRLLQRLSESCPVRPNTVNKRGGAFRV